MNNIFENAYFSKPYRTRDGSKAIFICQRTDNKIWDLNHPYACIIDGYNEIWNYFPNGRLYLGENFETENDIISEWIIDDEKLDKLAIDDIFNILNQDYFDGKVSFNKIKEIYKAGFRKAIKYLK